MSGTARRYLISGRVQGVGFRFFAESAAMREGLHGWVRNLPDGRVEIAAEGERVTPFAWKAIVLVLGGVCLFGAIVIQAGLVIATTALIFVTGYASKEFNVKESIISSIVLSLLAVLMFVVGLKLQFPIFPWGM